MNNTEIVKQAYEHFGSGDIEALLGLYSDDVSWTIPTIENVPFSGSRNGKPAVAEFFSQLVDAEEFSYFAPSEFIAEGDRVVVLGSSKATVKSTGKKFETDWVHVCSVKDGKITSFLEFFDNAGATRAYQKSATA
jgi:ketosteroid isomerase-like protein